MSISKTQIKHLRGLRDAAYRKQHGEFIAEGFKILDELLSSKLAVNAIYATKECLSEFKQQQDLLTLVSEKELERISALSTPSMVLATANTKYTPLGSMNLKKGLSLFLDGISDPGNMGSILRSAEWFGIENIVCSTHSVDVYNPKVVQASVGSLFRLKIAYAHLPSVLIDLNDAVAVYGTFTDGDSILSDNLSSDAIIVIGNESHGISGEIIPLITHGITIPRPPGEDTKTESLNASVAAAIVCYEFTRSKGTAR